MKPIQKHGAFECLEYEPILIMDKLCKEYGYEIHGGKGGRKTGRLNSYTEVLRICQFQGEECLKYIFEVCKMSRFDIKPSGTAQYVVRGLKDIWKEYPFDRENTCGFLGSMLRQTNPLTLKADAVSKYPLLNYGMAVSLYLEDVCVENLGLNQIRKAEGKHVVKIVA